jgi:CheY-like chemotaxis protein
MTPETDTAARVMISAMAGERVLIVDDDADIRESTGEYLAGHGYRTAFAATASRCATRSVRSPPTSCCST